MSVIEAVQEAPVLTEWAQKVKGQSDPDVQRQDQQEDFMFNPATYSAEVIVALRSQCERTFGKHHVAIFREGTDDEWQIVQGIVEGNIVCRSLPQFFNRIMAPDDKLRVIETIRAQVEGRLVMDMEGEFPVKEVRVIETIRAQVQGRLVMDMEGEFPVKEAFQSTKSLRETIATTVHRMEGNDRVIWEMLSVVKAISYDASRHVLNFHFFTRDVAKRYEAMEIPFLSRKHTLINAHSTPTLREDGIWGRQKDQDGEIMSQATSYVVILQNVARTTDMGKLYVFLKQWLGVDFTMDDLDTGGPNSTTSTAWELSFALEGCPSELMGIWSSILICEEGLNVFGVVKPGILCGCAASQTSSCGEKAAKE
ncbi:hypothetical protein PHMEG_00030429 [Phytophthora megakarya]|uniref:Uncharacterized protein n=1 Tax=Phytophthora megakarya TaxID=4795 RepID=A0A225UYS6_9STRA|nr:hypothetical protein PHMEG_00030429 [Phytophthora megakarya]